MCKNIFLLIAVLLAAGCSSAASHYRSHGDGPSLYRVLHEDIRDGQSLEQVKSHLGPGDIPSNQDKYRDIQRRILAKRPAVLPSGVEDKDQFIQWQYDGNPFMILQFRGNLLVNHQPRHFQEYKPFTSVR